MADDVISIRFDGSAEGLLAAAKQVSHSLQQVSGETQTMGKQSMAAGVMMGTVYAQLATKAMSFAKDALGSFSRVTGEIRRMQGLLGGTAEDMSRLRFAGEEVGVSANTISRSMSILSGHLMANDKAWKSLGLASTDANGKQKPTIQLLGEVSDKLNEMGKGLERTSTAKKLFGRGFIELNPLLAKGSEGIKKFAEESDKLGLTMTQKDLQGAKDFKEAVNGMHAAFEGLTITVGRAVTPMLTFLAGVVKDMVATFRDVMNSTSAFGIALRGIGIALATVIGLIVQYVAIQKTVGILSTVWETLAIAIGVSTTATEGATAAQWGLNAAMEANPLGVIVVAVELVAAAFILLIKKSEWFRDTFVNIMGWIGNIGGKTFAVFIKAMEWVGVSYISVARIAVKAGEVITGNRFWKAIFGGGANESVKGALKALNAFEAKFKDIANKVADTAWNKGTDIGRSIGSGITKAIQNFKLPSFKMPTITKDGKPSSEEQKQAQADALKKYWTDRIDAVKEALQTAKQAAEKAQQEFDSMNQSIASTMAKSFDVTSLVSSSFAKYLGTGALLSSFRQKLADAKEFVADLKVLKSQGLPPEMLQQIAAAGIEGGLDTARLLVGDLSTIAELKGIQSEINAAAGEAGTTVAGAVYGNTVATTSNAVIPQQNLFNQLYNQAKNAGVDVSQYKDLVTQPPAQINVDVQTNADGNQIARDIAWAISTGSISFAGVGTL